MVSLSLQWLSGEFAVCRLDAAATLPENFLGRAPLTAVVHTDAELSVVCPLDLAPSGAKTEGPWRAFRVAGTLDFALTGILAELSSVLAEAKVSLFAVSTFDTDYVLVRSDKEALATRVLKAAGHVFQR